MRHLEAFTQGKRRDDPAANEDSFVVMADAGYAVIDGVTDRNGTRYGGMLSGRFASRRVKAATERFILAQSDPDAPEALRYTGPVVFVDYLTRSLHAGYVEAGAEARAERDWSVRASCAVIAAFQIEGRLEVVSVGDSGIRINGRDVFQNLKPLDEVTGLLRREAWHAFAERGEGPERCGELAGYVTWNGTRPPTPGPLDVHMAVLEEIERKAVAACRRELPAVPEAELADLVRRGIIHGQGDYVNTTERVLGYGCLDGFAVPEALIESRSYDLAEIETIELFSDGYFKPGATFGIEAWERSFREVEAVDPHKIGPFLSTKGSTEAMLTDDRTYLGIRVR